MQAFALNPSFCCRARHPSSPSSSSTLLCSKDLGSRRAQVPFSSSLRTVPRAPLLHKQQSNRKASHGRLRGLAQVRSGEVEGNPGIEGLNSDEHALQLDLERAIKEEDYERAAKLRDDLQALYEDSKASVLAANSRFYNAFRNGDLTAMHSIWAKGENVCVVHPRAGRISGYDLVMGSWELVCGVDHEFPLQIDLKNIEVHVRGEVGYVTCMEVVKTRGNSWGKQVATNVFEKIDGQWFICIHHASHIDE